MDLLLTRFEFRKSCTIGTLLVNGTMECFTLEDTVHDGAKIYGGTAIPEGKYEVIINRSQRFGIMLPLLLNVPEFEGIRIHSGNTDADTSGCILVGKDHVISSVTYSRLALEQLQQKLARALAGGERVYITIRSAITTGTLVA